ncbi:hypothetical protein AX774_g7512 [Zancudomyces culisetae]|uniref:Uncharacterized protein n=1 Tax=Zancudomyces culisetae TaxID=1213189 RepID=A0A1R1PDN5_ZANCU|nr:hypothetical protein AX774_g7512 [Zancudomyces culisetae]|eukprot:OMH79087.1 hypothetical protein AX774_g7512 [Zancudomyces culisetae]
MQVVGMVPAAKRVISGGIRSDIKEISAGIATDGSSNRNSTSSDIGSSNRINDNTLELGTKNGQQQEYTDTSPLTPSHKKDKKGKAVVMYSPHYNQILFSDDYTSPEPCYEFENMVELKILRNASIFPPSDDHHLIQHEMEGETQL